MLKRTVVIEPSTLLRASPSPAMQRGLTSVIAANSEADAVNDNPATTQNRRHRHPRSGYISRQRECDDRPAQSGDLSHCGSRTRWQGRSFRASKYRRSNRISSQAIKGMIFETSSQRELRRCSRCIASLAETCAYDLQRGCLGKASMRAFRPGSEISENAFTSDPLNTVMKTFHDSCHSTMRSATSLFEKAPASKTCREHRDDCRSS